MISVLPAEGRSDLRSPWAAYPVPPRHVISSEIYLLVILAVVSKRVDLLQLGNERVPRVRARALVVERLLGHLVQGVEEVLLVHAVLADGILYADRVLKVAQLLDEEIQGLVVILALDTVVLCNLAVAAQCVRILVLREGAHPCRDFLRVGTSFAL